MMIRFVNTACGCSKIELEEFEGTRNCKGFVPGCENWQSQYLQAIKEKIVCKNKCKVL